MAMKTGSRTRICFCFVVAIVVWTPSLIGHDVVIIRLVNGKNGKAITDENLNVWINDSRYPILLPPTRDGNIKLSVKPDDLLPLASNIQATCHPYERDEHELRKYRVSIILQHGFADQNMCSSRVRIKPSPGEFVFYERPRTFWEWIK